MSSFRVGADVVASWKDELAKHRDVKGVESVLKEVLQELQKEGDDQHVPLDRHRIFSWTQALQGAAAKAPGGAAQTLVAVAEDMKSYLAPQGPGPGRGPGPGPGPGATGTEGPGAALSFSVTPAPIAPSWTPPPAVVYAPAPAQALAPASGIGATRVVSEREVGSVTTQLIRDARAELLLVTPWGAGLDGLARELLATNPGVQVRILTRRPPQDDPEFHRVLLELRKRGNVDLVASPFLHTRMVIVDGARVLMGAAGAGHAASRELAVLTTDAGLAASAREAFFRMLEEARGK